MNDSPQAWIQSPAPNLQQSRNFYQKLGFQELADQPNFFWDGRLCIELNTEASARSCIKVSNNSPSAAKLPDDGIGFDPNGNRLMVDSQPSRLLPANEQPFSALGSFALITFESHQVDETKSWWKSLGFEGGKTAGGWEYLDLGGLKIDFCSASCSHLFPNPGITYFNGSDSKGIIENLNQIEIPITQELTHFGSTDTVDDAIIFDPGTTGFFLFSDANEYY